MNSRLSRTSKQRLFTTYQLVKSDLYSKYRKSFIGIVWLVVEPLFTVLIWLFMHFSGVINPGESEVSYASFILLSTALWMLFINSFTLCSQTLTSYSRVIITANISYVVLLFSKLSTAVITSFISILFILITISLIDVKPSAQVLLLPIALLPLILLGATLGMLNALLAVVTIDLSKLFDYFIHFLKYATPVVYTPAVTSGVLQQISGFNPISSLIGLPRDMILGSSYYANSTFLIISTIIIIVFFVVLLFFINKAKTTIERLITG